MSYDKDTDVLSLSLRKGKTDEDMIKACQTGTLWTFVYESELARQVYGYALNKSMNSTDVTLLLEKIVEGVSRNCHSPYFLKSPVGYLRTAVYRACNKELERNPPDRIVEINDETFMKSEEEYDEDPRLRVLENYLRDLSGKTPLLAAIIRFGLSLLVIDYDLKCLEKVLIRDSKTKTEAKLKFAKIKKAKKRKSEKWLEFAKKHSPDQSPGKLDKFARASDSAFNNWKKHTLKKALTKTKK